MRGGRERRRGGYKSTHNLIRCGGGLTVWEQGVGGQGQQTASIAHAVGNGSEGGWDGGDTCLGREWASRGIDGGEAHWLLRCYWLA
jgi:hypothetical protein